MSSKTIPILIVGAGPVGLSLAAELGWRGIPCTVVEQNSGVNVHPRANVLQVRCQELFRRWGILSKVLAGGYPLDYPGEYVFTTRISGHEVFRFKFPSYQQATDQRDDFRTNFPEVDHSPGYKFYIGQNALEPILGEFASSFPHVEIKYGVRLAEFSQSDGSVSVELETVATGEREQLDASYMIGCDGGRSSVRGKLDIALSGMGEFGNMVGIYFRAPDFYRLHDKGRCALYWAMAPEASGVFIPIDGKEHFNFQRHLRPDETPENVDAETTITNAFGKPLNIEVITKQRWSAHALVADRYRAGRIFLAGDAAHLFVPTGGFGMNTGIIDAIDLGIRLAGTIQGWAGPGFLDGYEIERRPIAERNGNEAADNYFELTPCLLAPAHIERDDAVGAIIRRKYADLLSRQRKHFNAFGINLGYRYEGSPLIEADGTPAPPDDPQFYVPTTRPGSRAPHIRLANGRSILDFIGRDFVLFRFGPNPPDAGDFPREAEKLSMPFKIVDIDDEAAARLYDAPLVLVRPDGHVGWRGERPTTSAGQILDRLRGAAKLELNVAAQ